MKIGILTLSASDNCGSLLQAYALQCVLVKMGCEVEIINFVTKVSEKMYRIVHPSYIKRPKKLIGIFLNYHVLKKQKDDYQEFRKKFLYITSNLYNSEEELKKLDGIYDIIVCGSDQVWNTRMYDYDKAYALNWCNKTERVAYAVSLGDNKNNNLEDFINGEFELHKFKAVSVREKSAQEKFKRFLNYNTELSLDPTMLLKKDDWKILVNEEGIPKEKFIFFYSYNYEDEIKNQIVADFAKNTGLKVFVINPSRWTDKRNFKFKFTIFDQSGPLAFLKLMWYAEYSLVESFHGIIFSYIFQKQFWFLRNTKNGNLDDRINDLMDIIELKDRIMYPGKVNPQLFQKIDYTQKYTKYETLRKSSLSYINRILK